MDAELFLRQFMRQMDRFLERNDMSAARFGLESVGDPNFVHEVRAGRDLRLSTIARVQRYMRERGGE